MTEPFDWNLPRLKPTLQALGIVAVVLGLTSGAGYWQGIKHQSNTTEQAEARANVAKGEADAFKRQANAKDAEIAAKDHGLAEARADVARKVSELAAYRAAHPSAPAVDPLPDEPVLPGVADLAPMVHKQDEVIQAQTGLIRELETRVFEITASRDFWKASADARERETAGLRIALEAQKSLTKGALWKGRIQGFAVGFAGGYATGRLQ